MTLRGRFVLFALLLSVAVFSTGCGGFAASRSFSPLDFVMPHAMDQRPSSPSDSPARRDMTFAPKPASAPEPPGSEG